ncbi:MAG: transketolase [Bacteroidales bacterium]|nr:transketolase [Bacteroidales bacterium]
MMDIKQLEKIATQVRRDSLRMVHAVQSGHPGAALGCADLMTALYFEVLNHDPKQFDLDGKDQDLFFLSNGHLSAVWYSVLARSGYFPIPELSTFRKLDTRLQGHPTTAEHLPGVRVASGSLGQGLSVACGSALSKKLNGDKSLVFCLMGDGEIQEGQVWEAAMFASARKIDNLIGIVDYNGQQIDGPVKDVLCLGDLKAKWEAFGWEVVEMNGNNMAETVATLMKARLLCGNSKPIMILMKTEMGFGVDFMVGSHKWHGVAPNDEQLEKALGQLVPALGDY